MAFSALSTSTMPSDEADSHNSSGPWWGAWSVLLIVGCFYLFQAVGIFMVQMAVGFSVGISEGVNGLATLDQTWALPMSLLFGTVAAAMVSWQVATSRVKSSWETDWFSGLIGKSYTFLHLWPFVFLGLTLGLAFFSLTEYGVIPPDDLPQPIFDAMLAAPRFLQFGWALMFVILFPVIEEVLFRGFLFTGFAQTWGPRVAGVMTTLLFVVVHMPKVLQYWPALCAVILVGTLTLLIRIRTGSLVPGIALHSTYNSVLVTLALLTHSAESSTN